MKKIVLATPLYPPEIGGPATYAKELMEGLEHRGIEIELVKFSGMRGPKGWKHYRYYRRLVEALRNADAIYALDPVSVGYPAYCAAKKLGKPFVLKVVGDYAWEQGVLRYGVTQPLDEFVHAQQPSFAVRTLQFIERRVARGAVRVIVPSEYLKGILGTWGILAEKISVVRNAVTVPDTVPERPKAQGEFLIVSAGRRVPWKGFEAVEKVAKNHFSWKVFIASGLTHDETLSWIKTADVFVLNSEYEGLSHTLIEALLLGTPVVATNAGGNRELVSAETGILIPPRNEAELEAALVAVEKDPLGARARAAAARRFADRSFDPETMLNETAKLLESL